MRLRLRQPRLLELLAASRLSQNHWALKVGLSRGHWSEIVNGKHPFPSAKTRTLMLEAFQLPVDALFTLETEPALPDTDFRRAIEERYLIDAEIGQGGMGAVYLARDARHGRVVAIKVVSLEAVSGIGSAQFQREIATVAHLVHPGILPLFDSGEAAGHPFFVMPYVRGGSLRQRLDRDGRLSLDTVRRLTRGIAAALQHAHGEQILHCDIKPANVLLHGDHPWVTDFGIARKLHNEIGGWRHADGLDLSAGTPAYVSPEQASGEDDLDPRSDVYSLACMVYEMLAGRPPFEGENTQATVARRFIHPPAPIQDVAPEVPAAVQRVLETALSVPRERRPATPEALADELDHAAHGASRIFSSVALGAARTVRRLRGHTDRPPTRALGGVLRDLAQDVVFAWRSMRRTPGYALIVILTLGLALGANATMFGIVDRLMLRPPAHIARPEEVHRIHVARFFDGQLSRPAPQLSYPGFTDLRDHTQSFTAVAAFGPAEVSFGAGAGALRLHALAVTGRFFQLLGTEPVAGRFVQDDDDRIPVGERVVVLSYTLWRSRFAGDRAVVGRPIELDGNTWTIIGVAPEGFTGPQLDRVDLFVPLTTANSATRSDDSWSRSRGWQFIRVIARLKPGVSVAQANGEATRAYRAGHAGYRPYEEQAVTSLQPLIEARDPTWRSPEAKVAGWLSGMAAIVLLIACANIASLGLARGMARSGEVAVRRALGVSRGRLLRQFSTESLVLAGAGCVTGLFVAYLGAQLVRKTMFPSLLWDSSPVSGRVLAITALATVAAALASGVAPLLQGSRSDLAQALHSASRRATGRLRPLLGGLLIVQAGLTTVLLVGAGLFVRSLDAVQGLDLGFTPRQVLYASVNFDERRNTAAEITAFYREAVERVRAIPGVRTAGLAVGSPFMNNYATRLRIPGVDSIPPLTGGGPYYYRLSSQALQALGSRLVRGRLFTPSDDVPGAAPVAIVTELMAHTLWQGRDPLAQCLIVDNRPCAAVVGIVADMHREGLREDPFMQYIIPLATAGTVTPQALLVATGGPPDALIEPVRRALLGLRTDLPFAQVEPYETLIAPEARSWRLGATMLTAFGALSLLIAAIGVYGMLAFIVTQRLPELGVRAALGATPLRLHVLVVAWGIGAAVVGVLLGLGVALAAGGQIEPLLFGVSGRDPLVVTAAAGAVLIVSLLASLVPGRRAAATDPLVALRAE